jgi:two-component system, NarL family, sensor histidine kinase DegS
VRIVSSAPDRGARAPGDQSRRRSEPGDGPYTDAPVLPPTFDVAADARAGRVDGPPGGPGTHEPRPYTRQRMDSGSSDERGVAELDEQYQEAMQLVSYAANQLRAITERYRQRYSTSLARRHAAMHPVDDGRVHPAGEAVPRDAAATMFTTGTREAAAAPAPDVSPEEMGRRQLELAKLELAVTHLERSWLFLQRGDSTLLPASAEAELSTDVQMRIIEAQEAERQRLAQEVHDGPAQALTNAIFQVEYIERLLDRNVGAARGEIHHLRDLLRRELADVRTFITQLRPPLLDAIGLYGAIRDQAAQLVTATGTSVELDLAAPPERLGDTQQTVVLRIVQEALQNVRRHAQAEHVRIATLECQGDWSLEIHDDGRGFEPEQLQASRGARSYGLRFMRERADLIGATLRLDTRPGAGTHIYVTLPAGAERR